MKASCGLTWMAILCCWMCICPYGIILLAVARRMHRWVQAPVQQLLWTTAPEVDDTECKEAGPLPTAMSYLWGLSMCSNIVFRCGNIGLGGQRWAPLDVPPTHIRIREQEVQSLVENEAQKNRSRSRLQFLWPAWSAVAKRLQMFLFHFATSFLRNLGGV